MVRHTASPSPGAKVDAERRHEDGQRLDGESKRGHGTRRMVQSSKSSPDAWPVRTRNMKFAITAALTLMCAITIADDLETTKNSARLERMRGKAREFSVSLLSDRDKLATLRPNPVFRT